MNIQSGDDVRGLPYPAPGNGQPIPPMSPAPPADPTAARSNPLLMIWRRKRILLGVTALCVVVAAVRYMLSERVYRSEAKLFVQADAGKDGAAAAAARGIGTTGHTNLQAQCDLIKSASILANVLARPDLMVLRTFDQPGRWTTLKDNLAATPGRDGDVITVTFDSPYPKEAQQVLSAVVDAYSGFHTKEKRSRVAELEKWRAKTAAELEKKQQEILAFKKANGTIAFTAERGGGTVRKLASLQDALTQAHLDALNKRSALDATRAMAAAPERLRPLVASLRAQGLRSGDPAEQTLRQQLMATEQQLEQLNARYGSAHPAVRGAEASLAGLKTRIGDIDRSLVETHLLTLEQQADAARAREQELQSTLDEQKTLAAAVNDKLAEYEAMDAEARRLAAAVEKADLQMVDLSASGNAGVPTIQVLDAPGAPTTPIKPVLGAALLQGLLVGLLLGCGAALVRDWTDQSLRTDDDVTEAVGCPVLGAVPHIPGPPNPLAQGRRVDLEPAGDVAETYRTIRTAVFFGTPDRESRTILVTSPAPAEGKSTFASNLAIAMAQAGKRVLLLDADFRRPVQHRIHAARPGFGLSTLLAGREPLEKVIQHTSVPGLDLLPVGPIPANPAELLNSPAFNELLEELSVRYEHVVIDSPPVLAVADARILSAQCSVTILVLRAAVSTRRAAAQARQALLSVGGQLLGAVVSDARQARAAYGDYGGYGGYDGEYPPDASGDRTEPSRPPAQSVPADLRHK